MPKTGAEDWRKRIFDSLIVIVTIVWRDRESRRRLERSREFLSSYRRRHLISKRKDRWNSRWKWTVRWENTCCIRQWSMVLFLKHQRHHNWIDPNRESPLRISRNQKYDRSLEKIDGAMGSWWLLTVRTIYVAAQVRLPEQFTPSLREMVRAKQKQK